MMHPTDELRTLGIRSLPLRIRALLCDATDPTALDRIATSLYDSPMNDFGAHPHTSSFEPAPAGSGDGASLFSFLAVAEQLYERIAEALSRIGLSYAKYEVLRHLRDAEGSVSLGCLAEAQRCARSNITQLMDRLESEGLVRRVDHPADRRSVRAELTPLGIAQADAGTMQIEAVREQFAASFSAPERAELARLLAKLR